MSDPIICRLCLMTHNQYCSILSERMKEQQMQVLIKTYLRIEFLNDILICLRCIETVNSFHNYFTLIHKNQLSLLKPIKPEPFIPAPATEQTLLIPSIGNNPPEYIKINVPNIQVKVLPKQNFSLKPDVAVGDYSYVIMYPEATAEDPKKSVIEETLVEEVVAKNIPQDSQDLIEYYITGDVESQEVEADCQNKDNEFEVGPFDDTDEPEEDLETIKTNLKDEPLINDLQISEFPKKLIENHQLILKGKELSKLVSKFYRLECDLCLESSDKKAPMFRKLNSLTAHFKTVHKSKSYVVCCGKKIFKFKLMSLHMASHLQPSAFTCNICNKLLTSPKILQYHLQNHSPESERPLKCPDCPRRFSYQSALVTHQVSHLPENERTTFCCDECGKTFSTAGRLQSHMNITHIKLGYEFLCHLCTKSFACKSNLSYHLTTHQPKDNQLQCNECKKWLKNKLCLRKHSQIHSQIRHNCTLCDYSALNKQCLTNHIRVQHSDLKPFICNVCNKSFKLKNTLTNHQAQHTGIKKFNCDFCSRSFVSSGNYYAHRKRMHPKLLLELKQKKEQDDNRYREEVMKRKANL